MLLKNLFSKTTVKLPCTCSSIASCHVATVIVFVVAYVAVNRFSFIQEKHLLQTIFRKSQQMCHFLAVSLIPH